MSNRKKKAFTLVEMLVVISIIGVLASLLLPAVQAARESARRSSCVNNQTQIAKAIAGYNTVKGTLPPTRRMYDPRGAAIPMNWPYSVLPQLGREDLFDTLRQWGPRPSGANAPVVKVQVNFLVCPSFRAISAPDPMTYVLNGGRVNDPATNFDWKENGAGVDKAVVPPVPPGGSLQKQILDTKFPMDEIHRADGLSNTILLSENLNIVGWVEAPQQQHASFMWWPVDASNPEPPIALNKEQRRVTQAEFEANVAYARPSSWHPGGFVAGFGDGRAQFIGEDIDYTLFARLMSSNGAKTRGNASESYPRQNDTTSPYPAWQGNPITSY